MRLFLTAIAATLIVIPNAVTASTGSSNGQTAHTTGNGAATYVDPFFGSTSCNETQHAKFDTVTCHLDTPRLDLAGTTSTVGWNSDFNGTFGSFAYTVSADGTTYYGKATY